MQNRNQKIKLGVMFVGLIVFTVFAYMHFTDKPERKDEIKTESAEESKKDPNKDGEKDEFEDEVAADRETFFKVDSNNRQIRINRRKEKRRIRDSINAVN